MPTQGALKDVAMHIDKARQKSDTSKRVYISGRNSMSFKVKNRVYDTIVGDSNACIAL